jgi:Holliday junction resolvasome RuvABC endonuclease subunit
MTNKPLKILAINPGTRYLGIAVFIDTELRDWAVRVIKGKNVTDCVTDYVNQYGINVIVIKKLHVNRSSKALRRIADEIENLAVNRKIVFHEYSIDELKEKLLSETRGNKHLLMEEMSARYPFLLSDLEKESNHKNPYLIRMFEAVALGTVCFNAIDTGKKKGRDKTIKNKYEKEKQ